MSSTALHSTLNISETVRDRGLVPKSKRPPIENGIWELGVSNGHVIDDVPWPQRCCKAVRSATLATAWLLVLDQIYLNQFTLHARCCCSATHSCTFSDGQFCNSSVNPKHDWIDRGKCFSQKIKLINRTIDLRRLYTNSSTLRYVGSLQKSSKHTSQKDLRWCSQH